MNLFKSILFIVSLTFALSTVQAASVSITPTLSSGNVGHNATLELFMDFTGDPTLGGGIDLALSGPISWVSFTPSAYFSALDSIFTGHGTTSAISQASAEIISLVTSWSICQVLARAPSI